MCKIENQNNIAELKKILFQELSKLITEDYALLEVPDYDNIGDNLIWQGELDFLEDINYQKKYECSYLFFDKKKIENCNTLLFQGGGNFGDIYQTVQNFRLKIFRDNKHKNIIIFPQTVYYQNIDNAKKDAEIINKCENITICVRDKRSYDFVKEYFFNAKVLLLPDMAFYIKNIKTVERKIGKNLIMKRNDKEAYGNEIKMDEFEPYDILDWPTFNMAKNERYKKLKQDRILDKIAVLMLKIPFLCNLVDSRYGIKSRIRRENYIKEGIAFFNNYDRICTTRLHGLILGILMNKHTSVLDNSYGKISAFYKQWLLHFEKIEIRDN